MLRMVGRGWSLLVHFLSVCVIVILRQEKKPCEESKFKIIEGTTFC